MHKPIHIFVFTDEGDHLTTESGHGLLFPIPEVTTPAGLFTRTLGGRLRRLSRPVRRFGRFETPKKPVRKTF